MRKLIAQRLRRCQDELARGLAAQAPPADLERQLDEIHLLERVRTASQDRYPWAMVLVVFFASAAVAIGLHFLWVLPNVSVTMVAAAAGLSVTNGDARASVSPQRIPLDEVGIVKASGAERWCASAVDGCERRDRLSIDALFVNARSTVHLEADGTCTSLVVLEGGAEANVSFEVGGTSEGPEPRLANVVLTNGDRLRFCPAGETGLMMQGLTEVLVGDDENRTDGHRRPLPTVDSGEVRIADTDRVWKIERTDVLRLGGVTDDTLQIALGRPPRLTLASRASRLDLEQPHGRKKSLMPSALEWLRSSTTVRGVLALFATLWGLALSVREKWNAL